MAQNQSRIKLLLDKYVNKEATPEEIRELFKLSLESSANKEFLALLIEKIEETEVDDNYNKEEWDEVFAKIKDDTAAIEETLPYKKSFFSISKIAVAASIMGVLGLGAYFYQHNVNKPTKNEQAASNDIAPGKNTATLTLSNGKKIVLSSALKGQLAKDAGVAITKTADGKIVYKVQDNNTGPEKINTLTTAKGETYQVDLPDGTKVWLNAASSLKYPASFATASDRRVTLTGEAYFEVAKDKAHPFKITTAKQEVTVLGTHFNINSYDDEPSIKTTLIEGSVKVASFNGNIVTIKPGEQSIVSGNTVMVKDADTEAAIAWKNGYFEFNKADIKTVMRQIARWYDVEISYEGNIPERKFSGEIDRNTKASRALEGLSFTKIHFRIDGKKIIVTP